MDLKNVKKKTTTLNKIIKTKNDSFSSLNNTYYEEEEDTEIDIYKPLPKNVSLCIKLKREARLWNLYQQDLFKLSKKLKNGYTAIIPKSSHFIMKDQVFIVVESILNTYQRAVVYIEKMKN